MVQRTAFNRGGRRMREIKFRAFVKKRNKIVNVDKINFEEKYITRYLDDLPFPTLVKYPFEDIVLMQYAGIKDKNGKEIYEGDIVNIHQTVNGENVFVIEITNTGLVIPSYRFDRNYKYQYNIRELLEVDEYEKEIEVIGNIYENPELLEVI